MSMSRRDRGRQAYYLAHARRDNGDWRSLGPWLAQYLCSLTVSPMTDKDIAETVRGIAEAHTLTEQAKADDIGPRFLSDDNGSETPVGSWGAAT